MSEVKDFHVHGVCVFFLGKCNIIKYLFNLERPVFAGILNTIARSIQQGLGLMLSVQTSLSVNGLF